MIAPICKHAPSGCDYPAGECQGACLAGRANTGGPAFPISLPGLGDNGAGGMSLRDYFAAKAMQGAFTGSPIPCTTDEHAYIAMHAYRMADAMLAAREKQS